MKRSKLIYLNIERAKREAKRETSAQKFLRILLGVTVILGTFAFVYSCEQNVAMKRKTSFQNCLATGSKPMSCSFEIAFTEKY